MNPYPAPLAIRTLKRVWCANCPALDINKLITTRTGLNCVGIPCVVAREVQLRVAGLIGASAKVDQHLRLDGKSAGFIVGQKATAPPGTPNQRVIFRPCVTRGWSMTGHFDKSHPDVPSFQTTIGTGEHQPSTSCRTLRQWSLGECQRNTCITPRTRF